MDETKGETQNFEDELKVLQEQYNERREKIARVRKASK